jgi:hypothetical protein
LPEAFSFKSSGHGGLIFQGVIARLCLGWRDVSDWLQQPAVIEPVDPFERRELDGFKIPPGSAPVNDLGLVKPVDGFGESIVIGIANASD